MRFYKVFFLCVLTAFPFLTFSQSAGDYAKYIQADSIHKHLAVLASDSLEGRETASAGMEKAVRYVSGQFMQMGLPALANGTYTQQVPLLKVIPGWMTIQTQSKKYELIQDFYGSSGKDSLFFRSDELVFAGYGIKDSVSGWDDLKATNIAGKLVMVLEGAPKDKKGNVLVDSGALSKEQRINNLKAASPKAILWVRSDYDERKDRISRWISSGVLVLPSEQTAEEMPIITISPAMANDFLAAGKLNIEKYEEKVAKAKQPVSVIIKDNLLFTGKQPKVYCHNVLGYVEGTDLKDEVVIVTAHLDHLGMRGDKIYCGADDDGSGCATVLTLAAATAAAKKEGKGPRRSILFMTFTGEEKGLLGSEYYTKHPVFPLENTIADLNIDMIGRTDTINGPATDYVYIIGAERISDTLKTVTERANDNHTQLRLDYRYNDPNDRLKLFSRSDHYNFIEKGVPANFYFTGLHEDYHKPTDTIDKIDFDKTARIARLIFYTMWDLANSDSRPDVKPTK